MQSLKNNYYNQIEKFISENCQKNELGKALLIHFKQTVYWIKKLESSADEALLIAAIAHDIERIFSSKEKGKLTEKEGQKYHQEESARIIGEFLKSKGASTKLIQRVKMLVSKHEEGGNKDQNLLKDADSLSFLENNVEFFVKDMVPKFGVDQVRKKFNWMFERISSEKARQIAKPMYQKAIKLLAERENE